MTNTGFIIFHLLRKVNAFERINQRHQNDTQSSIEVCIFTLNVNCFTDERHRKMCECIQMKTMAMNAATRTQTDDAKCKRSNSKISQHSKMMVFS